MKLSFFLCCLLLLFSHPAAALDRTFLVVTNAAIVNHWPADDGFIGTTDDVVSAQLSKFARSSPNAYGTYSLIVTSLGFSNQRDPFLPPGDDTATFVLGSATIDTAAFLAPDVPLLKSVEFSGTELFPGHGPYSVRMTNPRSGTYSRQGNAFTFSTRFDFDGQFQAGPAGATNALADGVVVLVDAQDFGRADLSGAPPGLAAYISTVALPLAQNMGASGLLCGKMKLTTSGSNPGTPGSFPPLATDAVVLSMEFASAASLRITSIEATPSGVRIKWTALTGKLYTVEATDSLSSPFATLASNLTVTEYLDLPADFGAARFYRIRAD